MKVELYLLERALKHHIAFAFKRHALSLVEKFHPLAYRTLLLCCLLSSADKLPDKMHRNADLTG